MMLNNTRRIQPMMQNKQDNSNRMRGFVGPLTAISQIKPVRSMGDIQAMDIKSIVTEESDEQPENYPEMACVIPSNNSSSRPSRSVSYDPLNAFVDDALFNALDNIDIQDNPRVTVATSSSIQPNLYERFDTYPAHNNNQYFVSDAIPRDYSLPNLSQRLDEYSAPVPRAAPRVSAPPGLVPHVAPVSKPYTTQYEQDGTLRMAEVEFKRGRRELYLLDTADSQWTNVEIYKGDQVLVEADRSVDIGKLVQTYWPSTVPPQLAQGISKKVMRKATKEEINELSKKARAEEHCLELASSKVMSLGLPIKLVYAEYQFDRRKLTFYFESDNRVDFRNLIKELFKLFRTRIWLVGFWGRDADLSLGQAVPTKHSLINNIRK